MWVDDRQAFLLSAPYKERTIDLIAIDVDAVLVERSTTDVILRREFTVCGHASLQLNKPFHAITVGSIDLFEVFLSQLLVLPCLYSLSFHIDSLKRILLFKKRHHQSLRAFRPPQDTRLRLIADHRELHDHGVCTLKRHRELSF